jgi:alpha-D-ribose 1-methylphosphonate 5-triphosphate synthase subunit PhnL
MSSPAVKYINETETQNTDHKSVLLSVHKLSKHFEMHTQHQTKIPIFNDVSLSFKSGECSVLVGPSGMGKSTLLKCLYGNYKIVDGQILLHFDDGDIDIASCSPQMIHGLRREIIGYVSQFLRVIPRVPALDLVAEPLITQGFAPDQARQQAKALLTRLSIPERLWHLSPTTFSGGEQQRINIARGFIADYPVLLLDEPTASLDSKNAQVVVELIKEAKARGTAIIGIFHDEHVREVVADNVINLAEVLK